MRTSTAPTSAATIASSGHGSLASSQQLANAVIDYFTLIPGNLDAGWTRLTPHFQSTTAHGRRSYDEYWGSVAHVDVSNARGETPDSASATLTCHYNNGRVVTEQTQLRFVRHSGLFKIDEQTG